MHWFWRATIAVGLGTAIARLALLPLELLGREVARHLTAARVIDIGTAYEIERSAIFFLPGALAAILVYGLLTAIWPRPHPEPDTRCRKCRYILRGISAPRCPECGERI